MLENPAPPSRKYASTMIKSSLKRFSRVIPSPRPPTRKIPAKTSVCFPITITRCKRWTKLITYSPSLGDFGGLRCPAGHSYYIFRPSWTKKHCHHKILTRWLWEKISAEGGLVALQFNVHLKWALELLISVRSSPLVTF